MDGFLIQGITGSVILDTRRKVKSKSKEVFYPVKFRVTHKRYQIYFNAGFNFTEGQWKEINSKVIKDKHKNTLKLLKAGLKEVEDSINAILTIGDYSHDKLRRVLKKGRKEYINDAYEARIFELTRKGQIGTAQIYNCAKVFFNEYKKDLKFSGINPKWLESFQDHAIEKGLSFSTLSIYLRTLRTIFNIAISEGFIKETEYPFSRNQHDNKFRIKEGSGTKRALNVPQMAAFIKYEPPTPATARSKDLFLLTFHLGGINAKDLFLRTWSDIKGDFLEYTREKTKRTSAREIIIRVPLSPEAKVLLNKWGNQDRSPGARIFPFIPLDATPKDIRKITQNLLHVINDHLHKIEKDLGIEGITSSVARHSMATILKNSGASESYVKEILGHASIKTTQTYLKSFETGESKKTFDKAIKLVTDATKKAVLKVVNK
jgi:integrase/recombinase XerD